MRNTSLTLRTPPLRLIIDLLDDERQVQNTIITVSYTKHYDNDTQEKRHSFIFKVLVFNLTHCNHTAHYNGYARKLSSITRILTTRGYQSFREYCLHFHRS